MGCIVSYAVFQVWNVHFAILGEHFKTDFVFFMCNSFLWVYSSQRMVGGYSLVFLHRGEVSGGCQRMSCLISFKGACRKALNISSLSHSGFHSFKIRLKYLLNNYEWRGKLDDINVVFEQRLQLVMLISMDWETQWRFNLPKHAIEILNIWNWNVTLIWVELFIQILI